MRTTLLGSLLDVARATSPTAPTASRSSSPAASTCRRRRSLARRIGRRPRPARSPASGRRPITSRTGSAASRSGRCRRVVAGRRRAGRLLSRSRACWRRSPGSSASSSPSSLARSRSCTPVARRGSSSGARSPAGSARSTRSSAGPGTSKRPPASRSTWPRWSPPRRRGEEIFEDVTTFPAVHQDIAVVVPTRLRGRSRSRGACSTAGGELLRSAEVFDLYEGEQVGEGQKSLALRLEFRAPDRTLDRRGGRRPARGDRGRAGEDRGVAPWLTPAQPLDGDPAARVLVAGASRLHRRARGGDRLAPSAAGAGRGHLAQRRRHAARPALPALPGAAGADRARPRRGSRGSTRRSSPTRTAPRRRWSPRCAGWACSSSTSPPTSACATCPTYERWYGEHGAPELLDDAVYGLTELYRERAARGRAGRDTRAATRPRACWRWRRWPSAGLLADVVIDAKSGVSGAGRGGGDAMHYVSMDENAFAYKTEGHRHRPEIEQELAALGSPAPVTFVPHLLPLDQGELVSCYAQTSEPVSKEEVQALYRERYAGEPFVRGRRRPARAARRPRHQRVPHLRDRRGAGAGARLLGDRQPLEGRLRRRRPEPQPDARARRDGGAPMTFRCAFPPYAG